MSHLRIYILIGIVIASLNAFSKSSDIESSYQFVTSFGASRPGVSSMSAAPDNQQIIFACNSVGNLFKTINGGSEWKNLVKNLIFGRQENIYVPSCIDVIAYDAQTIFYGTDKGLLKSTDGGNHWNWLSVMPGKKDSFQYINVRLSQDRDSVYVLANQRDVYQSLDKGNTWSKIYTHPKQDPNNQTLKNAFVALDAKTIFLSFNNTLLKTIDGGKTWSKKDIGSKGIIMNIHLIDANTLLINDGKYLLLSKDAGETWQNISKKAEFNDLRTVVARDVNTFFVDGIDKNNKDGIYKTNDQGKHWIHISKDIDSSINHWLKLPQNQFLLATSGGLFRWTEGADKLISANKGFTGEVWKVKASSLNVAYAVSATGLYKTIDGGTSWKKIHPAIGDMISVPENKVIFFNSFFSGLYKSSDGGNHWKKMGNTFPSDKVVFFTALNANTILYATKQGDLYKSTDSGIHSTKVLQTKQQYWRPMLTSVTNEHLILGTGTGLYSSHDSGNTWKKEDGPFSKQSIYAIQAVDKKIVYLMTLCKLYRSDNAGKRWRVVNEKICGNNLAVVNQNTIFLSSDSGVQLSQDGGKTFKKVTKNAPVKGYISVRNMALSKDGKALYLSTNGSGVLKVVPVSAQ